MAENELITIQPAEPSELFKPEPIENILSQIRDMAAVQVFDIETEDGRSACKSFAYQVARTKTTIDGIGKDYVAELKALPKKVDELRKKVRDECDRIRDEVRQPVTEWERAEEARLEAKRLAAQKEQDEEDAYAEHDLREREWVIKAKEAEIARQEAERKAKEEAERQAKEQKERLESEAKAKAEAERKAANKRHRNVVQERAISALADKLVEYDTEDDAQELARYIVTWIDEGQIEHVTIKY